MPLLHSEDIETVESAIPLLEEWADDETARIARHHREVLLRNGHYPWRTSATRLERR